MASVGKLVVSVKSVEQRINRMVRLLTRHIPDWFLKIRLDRFNMGANERCIIGQLFDGDAEGCFDLLEVKYEETKTEIAHGCMTTNTSYAAGAGSNLAEVKLLNSLWRARIVALRKDVKMLAKAERYRQVVHELTDSAW